MEQALGFLDKGNRVRLIVMFPAARARQAALEQAARLRAFATERNVMAAPPDAGRPPKNAIVLELTAADAAE